MQATSLIAVATVGRHDIFGPVHKGLRRAHAGLLGRLGCADFAGDQTALLAALREHLLLVEGHLTDEDAFIHSALGGRRGVASGHPDERRRDHRASLAMLEVAIRTVEGATGIASTVANARQLYLCFTRFVAGDLEHMAEEETETWPLLCSLFSDAELAKIERAVIANLKARTGRILLRHVLSAANRRERVAVLARIRGTVAASVHQDTVTQMLPSPPPADRRKLAMLGKP